MAVKVKKLGLKRTKGRLLFVDKQGDVSSTPLNRSGRKKGTFRKTKVAQANIKRQKGYLYFVDKQGDISKAKMKRG